MQILLLTQYYPPEPVLKFADLARGLRKRGHEVQVVTGFPCYPAGEIYTGFCQRLFTEQQADGVLVTRVPQFPDHSRSVVRRALYYLSFALSAATLGLWRMRQADVILVYQSALPTALAAWFMSRLKRVPYVLDMADLWPESVAASGMLRNPLLLGVIRACMKFAYRGAARINVITEGYSDRLISLGVSSEKITLIYYWIPSGQFDPLPCDEQLLRAEGLGGRFNVMYAGAMGPVQDLSAVVEAAALLVDELPQVQFVMVGDGLEKVGLQTFAQRRGANNVRFLGRRSPDEVQQLSQAADALLVHLKPNPLSKISIPSKTFACMASGRPILMAVEGEASQLVEKHGCGITAAPSNPQALANAVRRLVEMSESQRSLIGQAGRKAYLEHYCSNSQIPKFEYLLSIVASSKRRRVGLYLRGGKRLLDLSLALVMLVIVSPLMLAIASAVRLNLGSPVFFVQRRPGRDGQLFDLYKFRTMRDESEPAGRPIPDAHRLTWFGRFLRATSLDELPELWNVVRGEMSLVGPRPLLPEYLPLYSPFQARRHEVRPGITGWAQINGRNELAWEKRFEYDVWYVDHRSLLLDVKIMLKTIWQVIRARGIAMAGYATSAPFTGAEPVPALSDKSVIVLGAGGHAKVVISTLRAVGWRVEAVYDDDAKKHGRHIFGVEVVGSIGEATRHAPRRAIIAIGNGQQRCAIASQFDFDWVTIVHPTAWVDPSAKLGPGTVVCAGAVVQPGCRIGRHAIVNTLAGVDHDCHIGEYTHIGPGAHLAGGVCIGVGSLIGTGANAIPNVHVGDYSIIGAGAVIVDDIPEGVVAVGCPAKVIKNLSLSQDGNQAASVCQAA